MPRTKTATTSTKKQKGKKKARHQGHNNKQQLQLAATKQRHEQQQQQHTAKEWFEAAEHAMTASQDIHQAIALYDAALNVPIDKADMDAAIVLEKRAEAKVSVSDRDGARLDFQRALQLIRDQHHHQQQQPSQLLQRPRTINGSSNHTSDDNDDNRHHVTSEELMSNAPNEDEEQEGNEAATLERMASLLMYIGQLSGGVEAVEAYTEGIQLLEQNLALREEQEPQCTEARQVAVDETRKQLAALCCGAAEVYLTDLCYDDNAEEKCEALVQKALDVSSARSQPHPHHDQVQQRPHLQPPPPYAYASLDALQTAASLRLSQCRGMEAVGYMQQCFAQLKVPCEALCRLVGLRGITLSPQPQQPGLEGADDDKRIVEEEGDGQAVELTDLEMEQHQSLPGFEFRCQTAKLLLECSMMDQDNEDTTSSSANKKTTTTTNSTENPARLGTMDQESSLGLLSTPQSFAEAAAIVLGSLLAENDEVIELWYLMGDAFVAINDMDMARYYYEQTRQMLQRVQTDLQEQQQQQQQCMLSDNDNDGDEEEQEEMLQTQLDEVECQLEDVEEKLLALPPANTTSTGSGVEPMDEDMY